MEVVNETTGEVRVEPVVGQPIGSSPEAFGAVAKKIAAVMTNVRAVEKTGENTFHHYKYAPVGAYFDMLRPHCAAAGLVILPRHVAPPRVIGESKTSGGTPNYHWHYRLEFIFIDAETGHTLTIPFYAQSKDSEDKGPGKALSLGLKYVLGAVFMIDQEDAEADNRSLGGDPFDVRNQRNSPKAKRAKSKPEPNVSPRQAKAAAAAAESGDGAPGNPPAPTDFGARIEKMKTMLKRTDPRKLDEAINTARDTIASWPPKWRTIAETTIQEIDDRTQEEYLLVQATVDEHVAMIGDTAKSDVELALRKVLRSDYDKAWAAFGEAMFQHRSTPQPKRK